MHRQPEESRLREYLDFAVETAFEAGRLTLSHFQTGIRPEYKEDGTEVTAADREAESFIRARIAARYPKHDITGEEHEDRQTGASHRWTIDPIDGTKAFARGVPLYAVLLALEIEDRPEVGVAYFPALDEMLSAATGMGCLWNGRRARVSEAEDLSRGIVAFTDAKGMERYGRGAEFSRIRDAAGACRGWSDAYGHALVATGRAEVMLDPALNPWDGAPFLTILREAGGYFGDWSGNETAHGSEGLSTTKKLLPEVLRLIEDR